VTPTPRRSRQSLVRDPRWLALVAGLSLVSIGGEAAADDQPAGSSEQRLAQRRRRRRRNHRRGRPSHPHPDSDNDNTTSGTNTTGGGLEGANEVPPDQSATATTTSTTSTDTTNNAATEAPSESHPSRPVALDIGIGFRGIGRSLSYSNDMTGSFRGYDLGFGPSFHATLEWFPGAHFTSGPGAHIGIYGAFGYAFGISSQDTSGNTFDTTSYLWDAGLRGRIPLGHFDLGIRAGVGGQTYSIADSAGSSSGIPALDYLFVRIGLSGRYDIADRVGIMLAFSYLLTLNSGPFRAMYFPNESVHGIDAGLGLAIRLIAGLEVRAGFDIRAFFHSLNPQGSDPQVEGATDLFYGVTAGLAYRL
jgi:hypothetical protein